MMVVMTMPVGMPFRMFVGMLVAVRMRMPVSLVIFTMMDDFL